MNTQDAAPSTSDVVVQQDGTTWKVQVTRRLAGRSATGSITTSDTPTSTSHTMLAAALAWRALASQSLDANVPDVASDAAHKALDELGTSYRPKGVKDDTIFEITAADEKISGGAVADGVRMLLNVLAERIALYTKKYPTVHVD